MVDTSAAGSQTPFRGSPRGTFIVTTIRILALAAASTAVLSATAQAQPVFRPNIDIGILANRAPLDCRIEDLKVFALTNTTSGPIAAGTTVHIDIVHPPAGMVESLVYQLPAMAVGAMVRDGTYEATSCTAWIEVPMVLAPSGANPPTPPPGPAAPLGSRPLLLKP
jgi:hypothetical protein